MCNCCNESMLGFLRRYQSRRSVLSGIGSAFVAASVSPTPALAQGTSNSTEPERIFIGKTIHTMDRDKPVVEAVAVRGGRIVATGSAKDLLALKGNATEVINFGDATVLPGFIDPHMHSSFTALRPWLDIGPFAVPDMAAARAKLREGVSKAKPGDWIQGKMLDPSIMPGEPFTKTNLDEIAPNNPVFILESNGHIAYVNSQAMSLAGVSRETQDPPQGRFLRDGDGNLTGRLEEAPAFGRFIAVMPQPKPQDMVAYLRADLNDAIAKGCTTVHDCGIGMVFAEKDVALIEAVMQTQPPLRYGGYLVSTHFDRWNSLGFKPGERANRFTLYGIKAWADGSTQAKTGFQREPYLSSTDRGRLNYTADEITQVITKAHSAGWQVGIHANGDAAIDTVIDAFEKGTKGEGGHKLRHRIEHCSLLHDDQITRMKSLGLSPSFLIGHVHFWGKAFQERILGATRAMRVDPCRSAIDAGLRISLHSDFNVTPIDPLRCVQNAVVRNMYEGGGVLAPEQRITVMEALRAVTIDAAWQCHLDHLVGSIETGKAADFVVLEKDPLTVRQEDLATIKILSTWIDGTQGYRS